jgi:hypothetical protein
MVGHVRLPDKFVLRTYPAAITKFVTLVEWEGVVLEVLPEEGMFSANIQDTSGDDVPQEYAEFYTEDLKDDDLPLLRQGAVFRWVIGKRENEFGTIERTSRIIFRRLPAYNQADFASAEARAAALIDAIAIE